MNPKCLSTLLLCVPGVMVAPPASTAQEPSAPQAVSAASLKTAIDNLGKLDYLTRINASRTVRRTPAVQALPALTEAVRTHEDGYVKYRALVLLTGFNDPATSVVMREAMTSVSDRLHTVAYGFFEHHPDRSMVPVLLAALDKEGAEFVRPALVRALAALGDDPRVAVSLGRETGRGEDFFRSAVIEALGEYKAVYAVDPLVAIAKQDGPLRDDAVLALGRIGDPKALQTLADVQRNGESAVQPTVAAALCLLGSECDERETYLIGQLNASSESGQSQANIRAAAAALGALAQAGSLSAARALVTAGLHARESLRAPVALALAGVALRKPATVFSLLESNPARDAVALLADGFDMLEEDLDKERFFALTRKTYWSAPEASPTRSLMQTLIVELDF